MTCNLLLYDCLTLVVILYWVSQQVAYLCYLFRCVGVIKSHILFPV